MVLCSDSWKLFQVKYTTSRKSQKYLCLAVAPSASIPQPHR
jgi:hypothetical protein